MSYNWGPHYLVPSEVMKVYSGAVQLREELDEDLLYQELEELKLSTAVTKIVNPSGITGKKTRKRGLKSGNQPINPRTSRPGGTPPA